MEEEEEKRSDTPERKDKDDSEEATISGSKRKELNPEEKEQDTAEVTGTPTDHGLGLEEKEGTILPSTSTKSEDVEPQNTNNGETGLDASLLSPKRHLERQVKLWSFTEMSSLSLVFSYLCKELYTSWILLWSFKMQRKIKTIS